MRIAEMLYAIASWLESPHNEALMLAEADEDCMKVVAESCVLSAALLKQAADEVDSLEPPEESTITPESIEGIANLASALDSSGNPELKKQASVLDELLLTIASPPNVYAERKDLQEKRIEDLKKKYQGPSKELAETHKFSDVEKAIDKSNMTKQYKILEAPLQARTCADHPGCQLARIGELLYQCEMDKKIYNYETGYTLNNGTKVPGSSVANQTQGLSVPIHNEFDSREGRLGRN